MRAGAEEVDVRFARGTALACGFWVAVAEEKGTGGRQGGHCTMPSSERPPLHPLDMHFPPPLPFLTSCYPASMISSAGSSYCSRSRAHVHAGRARVYTRTNSEVPRRVVERPPGRLSCECTLVHANYGHVAVLLIRFTSDYQGYKRNERPRRCAISGASGPLRPSSARFYLQREQSSRLFSSLLPSVPLSSVDSEFF